MEPEKFRIQNYRSIVDSGDCYFSPDVTVLAGQNEAGKTSILQALEDFPPIITFGKRQYPLTKMRGVPRFLSSLKYVTMIWNMFCPMG